MCLYYYIYIVYIDHFSAMCFAKNGGERKMIANHVLQLQFLGLTGFRFPLAHFPTTQATAPEINVVFWKCVAMLQSYGFTVMYSSIDGASTNRAFMKMNVTSTTNMIAHSPVSSKKLVFIMDYSHCIKKIR